MKNVAWQVELSNLITDPQKLLALLDLESSYVEVSSFAAQQFPLRVSKSFVRRMQKGNRYDPLLLQVLPIASELENTPGFDVDPLKERQNPVAGLLHKYKGRVLVTLTSVCAIHCRYCFRRHFPYKENIRGKANWEEIFIYLKNNKDIKEVILSGGDPLAVNDHMLGTFIEKIALISHVKILRVHTRLPIVIPARLTQDLFNCLTKTRLKIVLVLHVNHAQEINAEVKEAINQFNSHQKRVTLLNQSVLLKGINDKAEVLIELSEALFTIGILPYYLHILDKVQGAAHFDVNKKTALDLHSKLAQQLPGYLVPRLVCEEAGELSKTIIGQPFIF